MGSKSNLEIIAHRGLHNRPGVDENSRRAVVDAFESTVDGIEVDLQLLGDGSFVLHHDDTVTGPDSLPRTLGSLDRSEFRELVDYEPLFLTELLDLDWQGKRVILECKPNRNHHSLVRRLMLSLPDDAGERPLTLSSYDRKTLADLVGRTPVDLAPVVTGLEGWERHKLTRSHWSELHLEHRLLDDDGTRDLTRERTVLAWTVNDSSRREELERLGIKGIMTDDPDDV